MIPAKTYTAYQYKTMMKTAALWVPVFSLVIYFCAMFNDLRYVLFLTVTAFTYVTILKKLKNKATSVAFSKEELRLGDDTMQWPSIENYYTSLPLNDLFMLRLNTKFGEKVFYLPKENRTEIENTISQYNIPLKKYPKDTWLKYSHLTFAFIMLIICALIEIIINFIH